MARFERSRVRPRVVALQPPGPLEEWCEENGVADAIIGGFFIRSEGTPLGELRIDGRAARARAVRPTVERLA